jgi:hypothetical protein
MGASAPLSQLARPEPRIALFAAGRYGYLPANNGINRERGDLCSITTC